MRFYYSVRFRLSLSIFLLGSLIVFQHQELLAQATCSTPTNVSGFGVDGDVRANTPAGVLGDSWFFSSSSPGSGIGVIGTGAATATPPMSSAQFGSIIQAAGSSSGRNRTYQQRMSVPFFSVINGNTLLDAFAARDHVSPDSTAFIGSNKNGDNPTLWTIGNSSVPDKNDLIDVAGHLRRNNATNKLWMFAMLTKLSTSGSSYADIEIYKTVPYINPSTGNFTNTGPAATGGHTAFTFNSNATIAAPGDIILCMNYSSSSGTASIRIWCNINNLNGTGGNHTWFNSQPSRPFNFTGDFITGAGGNGYGYAEITSLSGAPCLMFSVVNAANTPAGDWGNLTGSNGTYNNTIQTGQLVNIAFNLTDIGLDFANVIGPCYNIFGSLWFKTRSSASYSSELKDCSGPYTFANFAEVNANGGPDRQLNCVTSQVTLTGTSSTPGATLNWSTPNGNIVSGAGTPNIVVNQPGMYILSAQSPALSSCFFNDTVYVTLNTTPPNVNAGTDKQLSCSATTVVMNGSSSTPGVTYSWSAINGGNIIAGGTTANATVNATGCYILTVTNPTNGCIARDTACVTINNAVPVISGATQTNVSCFAACNGSANFNVSGGQSPYTYLWNTGVTTQSISGLCAGTYTVTVTGSNGCTATATFNLTQPSGMLTSVATATQNVSCTGGNNGAVSASANGGTSPYSYVWNTGATSTSLSGLTSGTYTVTITDANGCTTQSQVTVTQPASAISATITSSQNIFCFGGSSGLIDLTPSGGTMPYNYVWNNGTTTQDLTNVPAGTYTVTVTDANGCSATVTRTLTQPAAGLNLSTSMTQSVSCRGGNNGAANVIVTGGTAPYAYNWSNGASTPANSSLVAGTYTVTVTDANSCTASGTVTITQPAAVLSGTISSTQSVSCFGGTNGSINLTVAGGTGPFSFNWSNGATSEDISSIMAGTYTVTITDSRGCTAQNSAVISQPAAAISASASSNQSVSCFGGNNGTITLSVSGGTSPYNYNWSNGSTTQNLSGLTAGIYTVTVTDNNGCIQSAGATVTQPSAALSSSINVSQSVSCFGGNNGSLTLNVSNGTSPYTFLWSNGSTSQNISSLSTGTYTVTITDANGCTIVRSATVTQPAAALTPSVNAIQQVGCFGGNNGTVDVSVSGGTMPYSYQWSNGAVTQDISGVGSGTYTVTVTDGNGCTSQIQATVSQPSAALSSSISANPPVSCFGGSNGAVSLIVSGGTTPYSYIWNNGATTQNISGVAAGTYTVTVSDANGCTTTNSQTITQPSAALSLTTNVTQPVSCFGGNNGAASLTVTGGTSPYSYNWSNGQTTQNASGLSAGSYSVTVTDANGCTSVRTLSVTQPSTALTANAAQSQAVSCNSGSNGVISVVTSGGTSPYNYLWNTGATGQPVTGQPAGTYTVTVTDANGCTTLSGASVTEPSTVLSGSTTTTSNISCFSGSNGSIDLTVVGGTSPYTYMWNTGSTSEDLTGLPAGNYTVVITDANGCTAISNGEITQPAGSLAANLNVSQNVACFGGGNGSLDLTVTGGTLPYVFLWSNGETTEDISGLPVGTYTVSITDDNGCISSATGSITQPSSALNATTNITQQVSCFGGNNGQINVTVTGGTAPYSYNWSNGATTQNLNGVISGTYTVSITDANGCTFEQSASVGQPAAALAVTVSGTTQVSCFGGNNGDITLSVNGGTAPYSYNWSNGATTQNVSGLSEGSYSVVVTDVNGCSNSASVIISQPLAPLNTQVQSAQSISCFGGNNGQIVLQVTGGTLPYIYVWSNGAATSSVSGLTVGTYSATVTDGNGCQNNISVTLSQPAAALNVSLASSQDVSCFGGGNGSIDITVTGGTVPYSYAWSNGAVTQNVSGLSSGTYTVTVTDANGCTFIQTSTINQPAAVLSASAIVTADVLCFSGSNGSIDVTAAGGTIPYTYVWNNGATTEDLNGLTAGIYTVVVTDLNGCTSTATAQVNEPSGELTPAVAATQNVNCFAGNDGAITLNVTGGTLPYSYLWSNGETTQDISNLAAGTYTVTVTDANGCTEDISVVITEPQRAIDGQITGVIDVSCFGGDNGNIDLNVAGGTAPYTYLWNTGATTEDLSNLPAGTYTVTITDANNCVATVSATVNQPAMAITPTITATQQVSCFGGEDGAIDLTVTGGTPPYSFSWSNGEITEDISNLMAGTYVVEITDTNGCDAIASITLTQPSAPLLGIATVTSNVYCNGGSNGVIDVTVSGGTPPYSFLWNNGETTEDLSNLSTGIYTVVITDMNGCTTSNSAGIGQPAQQLSATFTIQDVLCFNGNNGLIDITPVGGTAPYGFVWSTGATTEDIGGLIAGIYTVTISDANGCDTTLSATIVQPQAPLIPDVSVINHVSCFGGNDGGLIVSVTGGTLPYVYLWSNGSTDTTITGLPSGQYTLTVTDANGCNAIISNFISQPSAPLNAAVSLQQDVSCHGGSNGALVAIPSGGTAPYYYLWNNGATTSSVSGLITGTYTVTVTDTLGCTFTGTGVVSEPVAPLGISGNSTLANCLFGIGGTVATSVTGGTFPFVYQWSNGATTSGLTNVMPATYTVTVTDANGCTISDAYAVGNESQLNLQTGPTIICVGDFTTLSVDSIQGATYQWYFGGQPLNNATASVFTTPTAGYYYVSVTTACGVFTTDSVEIQVKSVENATISNNQIICPPEMVQLHATGGVTYQWTPATFISSTIAPNPFVAPQVTTEYTVEVTNEYGCKATLNVTVAVACDTLLVPNGFSPNDDGVNDGYVIDHIDKYPGNRLWVYNRWGNLIYKAKDYDNSWDGVSNVSGIYMGKKVPTGTYFFILDLNDNSKPRAGYLIIRR